MLVKAGNLPRNCDALHRMQRRMADIPRHDFVRFLFFKCVLTLEEQEGC